MNNFYKSSRKRRPACCGSAATALLITGLFLAGAAQLAAWYCAGEYAASAAYLRGYQLRSLCASYMEMLGGGNAAAAGETMQVVLQPGSVAATVRSEVRYNGDSMLRLLKVTATSGSDEYVLNQTVFSLPERDMDLGRSYALLSAREVSGTEYLPAGTAYLSRQEVILPRADYFKTWSMSGLNMETLSTIGLCGRPYYLESNSDLKISANTKIYGGGIIAANGNIVIGRNCRFSERVILLSTRGITLENGVNIPEGLLLAHGKITIGSGCTLGGAALAGGNIEINGQLHLTHKPEIFRPYVSVLYII